MAISGKVYIIPNPQTRTWELYAENNGSETFGVTHNIFPNAASETNVHDDTTNYGHGLPVNPGKVTGLEFREKGIYNGKPITEGSVIRVGVRYHASKTVPLPKLDSGQIVELDLRDFHWYAGSAATAGSNTAAGMESYANNARTAKPMRHQDRSTLVSKIAALRAQTAGVQVQGSITVSAKAGPQGQLSHWEVRFDNKGKTAFTGTAAFSGASDKNDGLGLESMPVPHPKSAAVQRIEANGNYGVAAVPGEKLRLGVRGYGWIEVALPAGGDVKVDLSELTVDASKKSDDFFDTAKVEEKRNEKLAKVQFFEDGVAINAELKPIVYRGDEAKARSTFNAPHVRVRAVEHSEEHPGGGWVIEVKSAMPEQDERGKVGFVATLKLGAVGWDPQQLPPKKLERPGEEKSWFLPAGANIAGAVAEAGAQLIVGTRGLGWYAVLPLPPPGKTLESEKDPGVWGFREDQYNRRQLTPEAVGACRL